MSLKIMMLKNDKTMIRGKTILETMMLNITMLKIMILNNDDAETNDAEK